MPGQIVVLVVTALIEKNGKYLVLKRSEKNITNKGKWQFPEGKVKFGENILKALKREVKEETNLVVTDAKLFGISSSILKEGYGVFRMYRTIFKCKILGSIKLSEYHEKYAWVDKKSLDKLNFIEGFHPNDIISVRQKDII
jgi:8-oxo-dGTP diphosphatase